MLPADTPILLLTTGGTIDKIYFDALSDYKVGESVVAKLLQIGGVKRPFRIEEVTRKDSLELDDADRAQIRERILSAPESHIVITHGTDTMTDTARTLEDIAGKTIVLVGALAPARFGESDASFNLGMAFATAQIAGPGVYISMSGSVFRADQVVKDRAKGAFVPR
ncbi:asparaginase [Sphingomonadales bacterium 56]|jgi:L-asparaginase|uniref:Asparaginase domain-containing protein n=1 Tax=Sphingobium agri TaxID=2933566 RepID=A0ABT0DY14_9SPHN|nr:MULTISPECIES: asparaginase domain-containing protein [Sphingomonadaceae]MBY2927252.1 asparaginase [Sphingomonadales bacterium 56]MBY2957320.1 asparaginase [Sphingomonadales bacterium 58]MCK0531963.1 asparaginase domain-containing protein [Sphingobium agri]CAD7334819.1 putative L-asparaginase [Sphingobium sp. S8]CAD7334838.1 putative L-asparaginase [Sphingobium sp. S6]